MNHKMWMFHWSVFAVALGLGPSVVIGADNTIYATPSVDEARAKAFSWLADQDVENQRTKEQIVKLWNFDGATSPSSSQMFEAVMATFTIADRATRDLIQACSFESTFVPKTAVLNAETQSKFYLANVGLFYGRHLAQRQMYEEALDVFGKIELIEVVDPATYLFYRAVCEHSLLMKTEGLQTLKMLLKQTDKVPVRYSTVATLMQVDLQALKEKSLDEVARKMSGVERLLKLGRGGQGVQKVEDEIIASLDEIIKKLEQQQSGGGGQGSNSNQPSSPAQDSRVKGSTAPGEVDKKAIGNKSGWGALPPKKESKAKNLINRNFPGHYRDAIEGYFKKLAKRRATFRSRSKRN